MEPGIEDEKLKEAFDLLEEIERVDEKKGYDRLVKPLRQKERRLLAWRRMVLSSAAVILPLLVAGIWWSVREKAEVPPLARVDAIVPGVNTARLILADKKEILLDTMSARDLTLVSGETVRKEGTGVVYESSQKTSEAVVYNELVVPKGGEYDIVLGDGTRVWLNADSKLKFPVSFAGKERRVYLEGEGYIDVARDTARPFIVETREQSIRVLGTAFNVYAHEGERMTYTTLARGSVQVKDKKTGKSVALHPGEQLCLDVADRGMVVREVDVRKECAWKDGMFVFNGQTLEQIMLKLSRWYNVTVFYQNEEAKKIVFKGNLPRYSDFQTMLSILEKSSEVKFSEKNRVITVSI